jgi:hypothetical protein
MPILDIQKRARELGRIRIGQTVAITKRDGTPGTRPEKLDRFRLTSASKPLLEKIAGLYGGTVVEWQPQGGGAKAWEVVTDSRRLPIMVPPQPVSQWYEYWTGGGCKHRCDGHTNVLLDEPCDPDEFNHTEALKRPTTRLNVVLRDVEGIGVWRLETHGWNAAVELPDSAEFLAAAGGYVNGWVSLEARTSKAEVPDRKNGGTKIETRHFMVPIIEIDVTPAELMAGKGRVVTPTLEGPVPQTPALPGADPFATYTDLVAAATSKEDLMAIWEEAKGQNLVGTNSQATTAREAFFAVFKKRSDQLAAEQPPDTAPEPDEDGAYPAEVVEDGDAVWNQILKVGGEQGMSLGDVSDGYAEFSGGVIAGEASAADLGEYLEHLRSVTA